MPEDIIDCLYPVTDALKFVMWRLEEEKEVGGNEGN